jgi:hypothetical protein
MHQLGRPPGLPFCHRAQGAGAIERPADYEAIASASPFLTHLSLFLPTSATALPQQMAGVLSACSKLEDLALSSLRSRIVDIDVLASGTQLLSLQLPSCSTLRSLQSLAAMVNLQSLDISGCDAVSDLAPLTGVVSLTSLEMSYCGAVSDLAPLAAMVNLQRLDMYECSSVSDLVPLTALVNLEYLDVRGCSVSDLAPIEAMSNLQDLQSDLIYSDSEGGDEFSEDDDSSEDDDGV